MRVLMINSNRLRTPYPVIPFGLCCIAAAIEEAGHEVRVLDLCFSNDCRADIQKVINELQPEVIGITIRNIDNCRTPGTVFLLQTLRDEVINPCKESFAGPIIIGGPAVGINGAEILDFLGLEFAIRGDGEMAVVEFLKRLEQNLPLTGIGGLVRRKDGQIVEDNPPWGVPDLNALPIAKPDRYIDLQPYVAAGATLQIQTKRGCALNCIYCTYNTIEGRRYRLRNPQMVADEIEYLVTKTGIREIEFTDSTLNFPLSHAKAVLRAIIAKKLDLNLQTMGLTPGAFDEELADLMQEAHFREVIVNAEAGCDSMLKSLGKNYTKADVLRTGKLLRDRGIPMMWALLLGAPGENEETIKESIDTMNQVASFWDSIVVGTGIRLYRGTPLAENLRRENMICTTDNFLQPVFYSPGTLSLEEINALVRRLTFSRFNYHIAGEGVYAPSWAIRVLTILNKRLGLDIPRFRLHILYRTLLKTFSVPYWKKRLATSSI